MIYFDNAASTLKKPLSVKWAMFKAVNIYTANPGRSGHKISFKTGMEIYKVRKEVQSFFGAKNINDVIFTSGCTEALNLAILGTVKKGGHIVTTAIEHNSVLRCVQHLADTEGITYSLVLPNKKGEITAEAVKYAIMANTYLVIVNHTSNVTGSTSHITDIGKLCQDKQVLLLVDAAQSAGHERIDIQKQNINLLAIAGHKGLYGTQGAGCLIINNAKVKPIKFGGTGTQSESIFQPTELPEALESGTLPTPAILGLGAGVRYVGKNFNKINEKIFKLSKFILTQLAQLPNVKLYSHNAKSGVISFEVENIDSNFIANKLSEEYEICTRSGLHCAPLIHKHLHKNTGLVRVSISHFNTMQECKFFIKALTRILQEIK